MEEVYNKVMYGMPANPKKNMLMPKKSVGGSKGVNKIVGGRKMTSKMVM